MELLLTCVAIIMWTLLLQNLEDGGQGGVVVVEGGGQVGVCYLKMNFKISSLIFESFWNVSAHRVNLSFQKWHIVCLPPNIESTQPDNYLQTFNSAQYLLQYQPSGKGGTRSPPATPHRLQHLTACLIQSGHRGTGVWK